MAVTFGETERSNVYCLQERMYVFLYIFTFIKYIVYKISNPTGWYHYLFQIYDACLEVKVSCQHRNHYNGKLWQNEGINVPGQFKNLLPSSSLDVLFTVIAVTFTF